MKIIFFFLFCSVSIFAKAQFTFQKNYFGSDLQYVSSTTDGGYYIGGNNSNLLFPRYIFISRLDQFGDTIWTRHYRPCEAACFQQTIDGGMIVAGLDQGIFVMKVDSLGNSEWSKEYFNTSGGWQTWDHALSIIQSFDGGYVFSGDKFYISPMYSDAFIIKTNATGDTLWTRSFTRTGGGWESGISVVQTADTNILFIMDGYHTQLAKFNMNGDTLWTKGIDHGYVGFLNVIPTADNGLAITGRGTKGLFILKTDSSGNPLWDKTIKVFDETQGVKILQLRDSGYIISGGTVSHDTVNLNYLYMVRTDLNGDTLWTRMFETPSSGGSITQTLDNDFSLLIQEGTVHSLLKIDSSGNSDCINPLWVPVILDTIQARVIDPQLSLSESSFISNQVLLIDSCGLTIISECFSINNVASAITNPNSEIILSPNPFHTTATLHISDTVTNGRDNNAKFKIYNSIGALVRSEKIPNIPSYILHRGDLTDGLYFYELQTSDYKILGSGKFVIE